MGRDSEFLAAPFPGLLDHPYPENGALFASSKAQVVLGALDKLLPLPRPPLLVRWGDRGYEQLTSHLLSPTFFQKQSPNLGPKSLLLLLDKLNSGR